MKKAALLALLLCLAGGNAVGLTNDGDCNTVDAVQQEVKQEEKTLLKIDKEGVKKRLLEDGFNDFEAEDEMIMLGRMNGCLQPLLDAYVKDRTLSEAFTVDGVTIKMAMDVERVNFWIGLDYMEVYMKNPRYTEMVKKDAKAIKEYRKARVQ